jgi:hypothetical protein
MLHHPSQKDTLEDHGSQTERRGCQCNMSMWVTRQRELLSIAHPPCSVEMNMIWSLAWISYSASPSSDQSLSLIRTRIPGRLEI